MSPFSSPPSSHGSTSTVSPSLTHNERFSLPGILHILVFPSRHLTLILVPPTLCSTIPKVCLPLGSFTLLISSCKASSLWASYFFLLMPIGLPNCFFSGIPGAQQKSLYKSFVIGKPYCGINIRHKLYKFPGHWINGEVIHAKSCNGRDKADKPF